jgi:effector-binding domain-containing protein
MRRASFWAAVAAFVGLLTVYGQGEAPRPAVTVRQEPEQVVAYTVFRGNYDKIGPAIGQLFMKLGQNGIAPQMPITFVYLNNAGITQPDHYLTEVRIPVGKEALAKAGTLGDFTDVTTIPALEYAVIRKEPGMGDPMGLRKALYAWVRENGYQAIDNCGERFLDPTPQTDYVQMNNEIMVPVEKVEE